MLTLLLSSIVGAADAASVGCTPVASVAWRDGEPVVHDYELADFGPILFGLDLDTGRYREHLVGGRAGVSGGGTLELIEDPGSARGGDFVGVDREDGAFFRIALDNMPISFVRTHRSGEVEVGTCVDGDLIDAMEGYPR